MIDFCQNSDRKSKSIPKLLYPGSENRFSRSSSEFCCISAKSQKNSVFLYLNIIFLLLPLAKKD